MYTSWWGTTKQLKFLHNLIYTDGNPLECFVHNLLPEKANELVANVRMVCKTLYLYVVARTKIYDGQFTNGIFDVAHFITHYTRIYPSSSGAKSESP